ncbi:hypothetical protein P3S68_025523 [Capsicum galapagoense]
MAMKVELVLFLAMLLFTANTGDAEDCWTKCWNECSLSPTCYGACLISCAITGESLDTTDKVGTQKQVYNLGCSLGHYYKFLVQNDKEKYGSCMTSCSANYCIGNIALKKAEEEASKN